jgi:hypothetical protein
LVKWSTNPLFRKLIYTPEWFLSIILQKKLDTTLGSFGAAESQP